MSVWLILATATSYAQVAQPAAWSTTPTMSEDVNTSYSFKSTSSYSPIVGSTGYTSERNAPTRGPRKSESTPWESWGLDDPFGIPTDNPIGTVTDPTPVGEPLILLLMAVLYAVCMRIRPFGAKQRHA